MFFNKSLIKTASLSHKLGVLKIMLRVLKKTWVLICIKIGSITQFSQYEHI